MRDVPTYTDAELTHILAWQDGCRERQRQAYWANLKAGRNRGPCPGVRAWRGRLWSKTWWVALDGGDGIEPLIGAGHLTRGQAKKAARRAARIHPCVGIVLVKRRPAS